ncbi:GMC oxidoreductase [Thermomonospora umbrina]|nr:GMC oxidoreductase [Thermomonospora umbrina]
MTTLSRRRLLRSAAGLGFVSATELINVPEAFGGTRDGDPTAIVIGSGFGGSVAALRLGRAGVRTLVIERGRRHRHHPTEQVFSNERSPRSDMFWFQRVATWPSSPRTEISPVPGLMQVDGQDGITIACGAAVGGGSVVYTGCTVQPPREHFEALWPRAVSYTVLERVYFPRARAMLGARTIPDRIYRSDPFTHSRAFDAQMTKAGYPTTPAPSAFDWAKVQWELDGALRRSATVGESSFGNGNGAKNDMTQTYLPRALETGHVSITELTEVTAVSARRGGGYDLDATLHSPDGRVLGTRRFSCDLLFMAAGSLNTTKLLVKARDTGGLGRLNEHVGANWGTNGDAFALRTSPGPTGTAQAAPCASTAFVHRGFGLPIRVENWYSMSLAGLPINLQFSVAVDHDNRGTWSYDPTTGTVRLTDWSIAKNAPAEDAARAFNQLIIDKGLAGPAPVTAPTAFTAHPVGGCELGKATDMYGRVHGHRGLYVMDSALMPGNVGGANPSLTVLAIAERNMAHIKAHDS